MEAFSVEHGFRRCALTQIAADVQADFENARASAGVRVRALNLRRRTIDMLVARADDIEAFTVSWEREDHEAIGALLGYPSCCRAAFVRREATGQNLDPTWSLYAGPQGDAQTATVEVDPAAARAGNFLLRWLGVTPTPHLPCTPECPASAAALAEWARFAEKLGFAEEVAWAREMLAWPAEWSALHGIAEIKLPILKFVTGTVVTDRKHTVQWKGTAVPDVAAQGLNFPFKANPRQPLTSSTSFKRGSLHVLADACNSTAGDQ